MVQRKGQVGAAIAALANRSPRIGVLPPVTPTAKARTAAAVVQCRSLMKDRIAILISHWFSTVRHADQTVEEIVRTTMPSSLAAGAYAQQSA